MKVNLFIVGAPKAGTTSLYHYLNEHPEVQMSNIKEPDYFSNQEIIDQKLYYKSKCIDNLDDYNELFNNKECKIYGDASVSYLFYPKVPQRIFKYNPKSKIIIMLRDPIERAYSHYLMDYRLGLVDATLDDIINNKNLSNKNKLYYQQFISLGLYYHQVKRYIDVFGKQNIFIIFQSEFKQERDRIMSELYKFLDIKQFISNYNKQYNAFVMPKNLIIRRINSFTAFKKFIKKMLPNLAINYIKSILFTNKHKPILDKKLRQKMLNFFIEDVILLENLLSRNLEEWKK